MKKKHHEDHVNHEAWAIPYADLMTLLLAFFVVMYAVSVVNEGKYRVMSESIIEAFNGSSHVIAPMPESRAKPRNVDPAVASPQAQPGAAVDPLNVPIPARPSPTRIVDSRSAQMRDQRRNLEMIRDQVQRALQPLIDKQMVVVRKTASWLEIELRTDILFPSGVARISPQADSVLDELANILRPFPNPVRIEGYTDDRPINTALYPSNWELSAARAASVARLFSEEGIDPQRLGIVGWSEYRPSADNATEDGRNHNRRVLVVILSEENAPARFFNDAQKNKGQFADNDAAPAAAASAAGSLPAVPALAKAPVSPDDLPANKVMLVHPTAEPAAATPAVPPVARGLPAVSAGAITLGARTVAKPDHGP